MEDFFKEHNITIVHDGLKIYGKSPNRTYRIIELNKDEVISEKDLLNLNELTYMIIVHKDEQILKGRNSLFHHMMTKKHNKRIYIVLQRLVDMTGNPLTRSIEFKCIHCKKAKDQHHAKTMGCPLGKKHRILGYTQFSINNKFEIKNKSS